MEYLFRGGADAEDIVAGLTEFDDKLFGTSLVGGVVAPVCPEGCGTVFSFDPASGAETVLYAFHGAHDGILPWAGLLSFGGALYGTTLDGGNAGGWGTVFRIKPATGAEGLPYSFQGGSDAGAPHANLIRFGGLLYGTTQNGGGASACASGCGVYSSGRSPVSKPSSTDFKGSPMAPIRCPGCFRSTVFSTGRLARRRRASQCRVRLWDRVLR